MGKIDNIILNYCLLELKGGGGVQDDDDDDFYITE